MAPAGTIFEDDESKVQCFELSDVSGDICAHACVPRDSAHYDPLRKTLEDAKSGRPFIVTLKDAGYSFDQTRVTISSVVTEGWILPEEVGRR